MMELFAVLVILLVYTVVTGKVEDLFSVISVRIIFVSFTVFLYHLLVLKKSMVKCKII